MSLWHPCRQRPYPVRSDVVYRAGSRYYLRADSKTMRGRSTSGSKCRERKFLRVDFPPSGYDPVRAGDATEDWKDIGLRWECIGPESRARNQQAFDRQSACAPVLESPVQHWTQAMPLRPGWLRAQPWQAWVSAAGNRGVRDGCPLRAPLRAGSMCGAFSGGSGG